MKLATFRRGGVHPDDMKRLSKDRKLERLPMPEELIVSMSQHLGAPATLVKKKGDPVARGEVIGTASGYISADVHSPADGVIAEIRRVRVQSGAVADAAVIKCSPEQSDPWTEKHDWQKMPKEDLLELVRSMGIVGMGGATFPTSVKLTVPMGRSVEALVINGVECEPYLTSDYRLMVERPDEVLEGIMVAAAIVDPGRIILAIEANKMDAVELLSRKASEHGYPISVMPLKVKYPQGDEKQLLKATIGREVPSGKLPLDVGAVVCNLGTCNALYEAAVYHKPLIERVITVSGESIVEPKNIIAPIGTKFSDLIAYCKGEKDDAVSLVAGGPMMGFDVYDDGTPMVKGSGGLLSLPELLRELHRIGNCVR